MNNVPQDAKCMAVQHSDQMVCERCALRWDVNDSAPPTCQLRAQRQQWDSVALEAMRQQYLQAGALSAERLSRGAIGAYINALEHELRAALAQRENTDKPLEQVRDYKPKLHAASYQHNGIDYAITLEGCNEEVHAHAMRLGMTIDGNIVHQEMLSAEQGKGGDDA
jgi:hypothetical protein